MEIEVSGRYGFIQIFISIKCLFPVADMFLYINLPNNFNNFNYIYKYFCIKNSIYGRLFLIIVSHQLVVKYAIEEMVFNN